jgi:hypothetical protein
MHTDKLYIWPCDAIAQGETELREVPLQGCFAVRLGRGHLDRALCVSLTKSLWESKLDGFLIAPPHEDWKKSFGKMYENALKFGAPILLGRRLFIPEYVRLVNARASDRERGVDISAAVDLNQVETIF